MVREDKLDSAWIAKITEQGSLAGSFVPPEEIRRLRTHTRYRRKLVQIRTAQKERCEKLLEDAHLKLSSVISDIHGVSGREMLGALAAGERDPKVLAEMARGVMRRKTAQLEEALDCSFFTSEHAFILAMMLDSIDQLTGQIEVLDEKITQMCAPYEHQISQLDGIPGFGVITAQDLIAEIGTDMTVFPTGGHLASWARQTPRVTESAGKRKGKNATGRGNPYIGGAPHSAKPPSASAAPRPSSAPSTGACAPICRKRKPRPPSCGPSSSSPTPCCLTPTPDTRTSDPTTTNARQTPAAAPATTPAPWNASATRSPSRPSTPEPANCCPSPQPVNRTPDTPAPTALRARPAAGYCRLPS